MGSFYPHGKPPEFAYTTKFLTVGNDWKGAAYSNTLYPGLYSASGKAITNRALDNLKTLINAAKASELAFLEATGINLKDPNASNIFRSMNEIFNSKQTFERGLQYMKSIAQSGKNMEKNEMYRDVTRYFSFYLNEAIRDKLKNIKKNDILRMTPAQIEAKINSIISDALIRSYKKVKDFVKKDGTIHGKFGKNMRAKKDEQEVQAISDMIEVIKKLRKMNAFGKYGYLFNLDEKSLFNRKKNAEVYLKKNSFNDAKVDANYGGNALELITSIVAAEIGNINIANSGLTITGVHTGQMNQMKADTMLFVGKGRVNPQDYLEYVNNVDFDSVRAQNIDAMSNYLNNLQKNIEHVIMISDKNYSITANFGGINAQEKTNLKNAGEMLGQFGFGATIELINYLANCGAAMVQGEVNDEIRTELQTMIGYFLFDHLQIHVQGKPPGPNVVNLLNVSGIYIPLSVYLEGLYNSLKNALSNPASFVSVSISMGGPTEQSEWTESAWKNFREEHETQSFISYRILKGIADFISGL